MLESPRWVFGPAVPKATIDGVGLLGQLSRVPGGGLVRHAALLESESPASNTGDRTVEHKFSVTDLNPDTCLEYVKCTGYE